MTNFYIRFHNLYDKLCLANRNEKDFSIVYKNNHRMIYKNIDITDFIHNNLDYINGLKNINKEKIFDLCISNPEVLTDKILLKVLL